MESYLYILKPCNQYPLSTPDCRKCLFTPVRGFFILFLHFSYYNFKKTQNTIIIYKIFYIYIYIYYLCVQKLKIRCSL